MINDMGGSYIGDVKFCIILINRRKRGDNTLGGGLLGGRKGSTGDKQERGGDTTSFCINTADGVSTWI